MKRTIITLAIAILIISPAAFAQMGHHGKMAPGADGPGCGMMGGRMGGGMHGDMARPGMILRMADEIGLDTDQKARIEKMAQENGLARIDKQAELEKAQLKLRHLQMSDGPEAEVLTQMDKVGQLKTDLRKMAYKHHNAVKKVLTAEQLDKIKEMKKEFRGRGMRQGKGMGMNNDGPRQGRGYGMGDGTGPRADCPNR